MSQQTCKTGVSKKCRQGFYNCLTMKQKFFQSTYVTYHIFKNGTITYTISGNTIDLVSKYIVDFLLNGVCVKNNDTTSHIKFIQDQIKIDEIRCERILWDKN